MYSATPRYESGMRPWRAMKKEVRRAGVCSIVHHPNGRCSDANLISDAVRSETAPRTRSARPLSSYEPWRT